MADREELQKLYSYHEMSNKVERADRSAIRRVRGEPTGEVESLRNRTDVGRMGDRIPSAAVATAATLPPPRKKTRLADESAIAAAAPITTRANTHHKMMMMMGSAAVGGGGGGGETILDLGSDLLSSYQPRTEQARVAYEQILMTIGSRNLLGHQGPQVLRDAVQEVIVLLMQQQVDAVLPDTELHNALSRLLTGKPSHIPGGLRKDQFTSLVQLVKQLDDYRDVSTANNKASGSGANSDFNDQDATDADTAGGMDDEMGVAVVFDDSDDEAGAGHDGDEDSKVDHNFVVDDNSSSDEEEKGLVADVDADTNSRQAPQGGEDGNALNQDDEEKVVQGLHAKDHIDDENDVSNDLLKASTTRQYHASDRHLSVHEIDAHFLQRKLAVHVPDATEAAQLAQQVLEILDIRRHAYDVRECENRLLVLLGFDLFATIKLILNNRLQVWACISLKRAQSDSERASIEEALLAAEGGRQVLDELNANKGRAQDWTRERLRDLMSAKNSTSNRSGDDVSNAIDAIGDRVKNEHGDNNSMQVDEDDDKIRTTRIKEEPTELNLEMLALKDGAHTMSSKTCTLPDSSWRAMRQGYEEVHVPAIRSVIPADERLVSIAELPAWTHAAFKGMDKLNRVQSKMCDIALKSSENLLLCAPTGAGKTNVACLTMLNILGQYRRAIQQRDVDQDNGAMQVGDDDQQHYAFDLKAFKMVYIAPMKALVQEVVKNFAGRFKEYGLVVRELSGDSSLSRQQIAETQLLVTTPEKWDIVTRQGEGRAYTQLVKLVILDEIHLLHDERGPVLETIVARVIRQVETTAEPIRLVGLSATLPNYFDVATFLRVKPDRGLFFFDYSYRPVPLQMQYLGITERNAFRRFQLQNEICYEKALDQRRNGHQMLIFVHSRAETGKTAKALRDLALERDELSSFVRDGGATQEILKEESAAAKNTDLRDVLSYGFAIHHAGMAREDRELVEDLFADRHIAVLCCTATLAWGVNLPAHAVIIRGTQVYDPTKGRWAELSPLDVLQMLGRAGRPQYDSEGEGIILTQHSELQYYLSLTNLQLPVESQLIKTLPDHLNAEIVLGTVQTIDEAVDWLSYTFLYVRMLQNPALYGIPESIQRSDPSLLSWRRDLAHTAAAVLEKSHLIRYERKSGALHSTPLGRVSSQFYISHSSMSVYMRNMRPNLSDIELLRLFAMSGEFSHITVRENERMELSKLSGRVPIPVKESPTDPLAKVNILLQAYISRLKLEGFSLVADMAFIQQSGSRIMRALFEIAIKRNWASLARLCLDFANMVTHRIWRSQSPLRQFRNVPDVVARKLERKSDIDWSRYADLTPGDLGELVGVPKMGRVLHKLVHQFPRLELSAQIQPITRSLIRVELTIIPAFQFDVAVHGYVQLFHILVEDVNGEVTLHHEVFSLKSRSSGDEHVLLFSVPILDPVPPAYFVRCVSDRWLHSISVIPIMLSKLILPAKFPPSTELLDLQPLLPSSLGEPTLVKVFPFKEFNPIQTQTFHDLFKTDKNCLICSASGSGKSICGSFAILRMLTTNPDGKCVYVAPRDEIADSAHSEFTRLFGELLGKSRIARLSGETAPDLELLAHGKLIVSSVRQWDILSRRWRQRKAVQAVALIIFDELHFIGGEYGPTLEILISRTRCMSSQLPDPIRIVGLGASMANARDVGEWMGVSSKSLFNFSPKARPAPLEIYFQSFEQSNFAGRLMAMAKPVYNSIVRHLDRKSSIVYVPSRRQAQLTAIDIMTYAESQDNQFLRPKSATVRSEREFREPALQQVVDAGVGFLHSGMLDAEWKRIVELYQQGQIKVLVCPVDLCWKLRCVAHLVVIMGTEYYDGREGRHVDYPIVDLLHMMGRHEIDSSGKCVLMCHAPKKEFLKKLLYDPLPVESHLDAYLHDPLNSEIVTKTVRSMQDAIDFLTWTFLYRRLSKNPTYYGLRGTSNVHLSEYLSEMVETVVGDLEESKCCSISDDGEVAPLNLGMIAAYYYVQYRTIELIASSVTAKTKIRGVLEILSAAWEFSTLPIRYGEDETMKIMSKHLMHPLPENASFDSNTKALILLQAHFSRKALSSDLRTDQQLVLQESVNLIQAIVDVISSNGWLKPALAAMELSQMVVQGLWNKDHPLKQIPHFTDETVQRCLNYKRSNEGNEGDDAEGGGGEAVESVFDILTLDDNVRNNLLQLPADKMADVAVFCNNYPNVEVTFQVQDVDNVTAGDPVQVIVTLEREMDEEEMSPEELSKLGKVSAPLFPVEKKEGWWVVIGDASTNSLLSLKRVHLRQTQKVMVEFLAPEEAGDHALTLFCMSDSYLGCDQEYSILLSVAVGASDNDDDEDDDDDGSKGGNED